MERYHKRCPYCFRNILEAPREELLWQFSQGAMRGNLADCNILSKGVLHLSGRHKVPLILRFIFIQLSCCKATIKL
jgi:hypothetical protein